MAHNPSDASVRLMNVAVAGVLSLVGLAILGAALVVHLASREPGAETGWSLGSAVLASLGGVVFVGAAARTIALVVDWRRNRGDRSHRP
ncbi:MAG TPA: hypothetical protein VKE69_05140 [Planctomycetota bacterium]|nr:hypothetical protein [Planctomycetota bacterium]